MRPSGSVTGSNGDPVATTALPSVHKYAFSGVHSALDVGLDIGIMIGFALNDAEYAGLIEWLTFLGFANQDHDKLVIDPTRAVKDSLKTIFNSKKTMPPREFIKSLGKILPVMDGGNYHKQTMDVMGVKQWAYDYEKKISFSLSLALRRLEFAAVIGLEPGADDVNSIEMSGPLGLPSKVISNITLRGGD